MWLRHVAAGGKSICSISCSISAIGGPRGTGKSDLALQLISLYCLHLLANPESRALITSKGNAATLQMFAVRLSSLLHEQASFRTCCAWVPAASSMTTADLIIPTTNTIHEKVKAMLSLRLVLATTGVPMKTMRSWLVSDAVQAFDLLLFNEAQCGPDPADPLALHCFDLRATCFCWVIHIKLRVAHQTYCITCIRT